MNLKTYDHTAQVLKIESESHCSGVQDNDESANYPIKSAPRKNLQKIVLN